MRHLKTYFFIFILIAFISCENDDSNTNSIDSQTLVGTWEMTSLIADTQISGTALGIPFTSLTTSVGSNFDYTFTFTETTYSGEGTYDITTTGTLNGENLDPDTETITNENVEGTYTIVDGQIVFNEVLFLEDEIPESSPFNINASTSFDANGNLVVNQDVQFDIMEGGEFPATISTTIESIVVFTKVDP